MKSAVGYRLLQHLIQTGQLLTFQRPDLSSQGLEAFFFSTNLRTNLLEK